MGVNVFEPMMQIMGLEPRSQQSKLVDLIRQTLTTGNVKFVQAGTGTGKSFAILATALEAARVTGLPSIVVCPMNSLIDQYVVKDAPRIRKAVGGRFAYIKGRSKYLCAQSKSMQALGSNSKALDHYASLTEDGKLEWADHQLDYTWGCPGSGDCTAADAWVQNPRCQVHGSAGHGPLCPGAYACNCGFLTPEERAERSCTCQFYCGAFEAKRRAEAADVVITNAHVLVWDYLVRQMTGEAVKLIPTAGALFVDECHELEAVGRACQSDEIKPGSTVYDFVNGLREWVDAVTLDMIDNKQQEGLLGREPEIIAMAGAASREAVALMDRADMAGEDRELAKEYEREARTLMRFVDFVAESERHISTIEVKPITNAFEDPKTHLRKICVDTSMLFRDILTEQPSVLVSGTIPSTEPRRLGVGDYAKIEDVGHPFDYSKSTLAVSPLSPRDPLSTYSRATQVAQAINSTGGGALILFTSWRDLDEVMPMVASQLRPEIASEVYVQSREDPSSLAQDVEDFKAHGSAVLAGVRTLFTGLDIPGPALRAVILWKLPYGVPTLESKAIEKIHGRDVYWDAMKTVLVQGIGRLVRTVDDKGLVFIVDNRAEKQAWRSSHLTRHLAEFSPHVRPRR